MEKFSFVHTSDLHLDSRFKGISGINDQVGELLADATFSAYFSIIDYCIHHKVDFLLIAGDIYNAEDRSLRSQLKFLEGMKKLNKYGVQVYLVHGNHDPLSGWSAKLSFPPNVHVFGGSKVESKVFMKHNKPLAKIHGISFLNRSVTANLSKKFPIKNFIESLFEIGLLHCNVGNNMAHEPYAPCTLQDLDSHELDYWALGHIHAFKILQKEPWIVYSGCPQGINPKETGEKGVMHVEVENNKVNDCNWIPLHAVQWFINEISIEGYSTEQQLMDGIYQEIEKVRKKAEQRPAILRLVLNGRGPLFSSLTKKDFLEDLIEEIRSLEQDPAEMVWVENIVNKTGMSINKDHLKQQNDFIADLLKIFEQSKKDDELQTHLKEELSPLFNSPGGRKFISKLSSEEMNEIIEQAENFCLDYLPIGYSDNER